jgi:hypothetical protein
MGDATANSMRDDMADAGLIDISGLSLTDLLTKIDHSSLDMALQRVLATSQENAGQNGFSNFI